MRKGWIVFVVGLLFVGGAVAQEEAMPAQETAKPAKEKTDYRGFSGIKELIAVVDPTDGNSATGIVRFMRHGNRVKVIADIEGLTPNAQHGFHIHRFGNCSGADGKTAGGHYNPAGHDHGGPESDVRHAGDLGNLQADKSGKAHYERVVDNITLAGKKNPVLGRSIIVHAGTDDLTSQPTGAAGARIGCGVIGVAKKSEKKE